MRTLSLAPLILLALATPAGATGGFLCTAVGQEEPALSLVIGHGIPGGVVAANLREGGRWLSTYAPVDRIIIDQWWIDRERTWVDLVDRETGEPAAQLRVTNHRFGGSGTLARNGRTFAVRCRED